MCGKYIRLKQLMNMIGRQLAVLSPEHSANLMGSACSALILAENPKKLALIYHQHHPLFGCMVHLFPDFQSFSESSPLMSNLHESRVHQGWRWRIKSLCDGDGAEDSGSHQGPPGDTQLVRFPDRPRGT